MSDDGVRTCQECGATIYQEHLDRAKAGFWAGKMLCPVCLAEKQRAEAAPKTEAPAPPSTPAPAGGSGEQAEDERDSIALVDLGDEDEGERPEIRAFGAGAEPAEPAHEGHEKRYRRPLNECPSGATRCRTFHAKLNDGAIAYMNEQINEWCDNNPHIDMKFATSAIGIFEGKHPEPHLIVTVFY